MKSQLHLTISLLFLLLLINFSGAEAQYVIKQKQGTDAAFNDFYGSYNIFKTPAQNMVDNELSYWRKLPFDFNFYGEKVTGYYVSDNGYITFDTTATQSIFANTALPDAGAPKNAIFAFWDDLRISPSPNGERDWLATFTYGEAPYRVHVIQWYSVSTKNAIPGGENFVTAAIRLYECGNFDVVLQKRGNKAGKTSSTIGCQDKNAAIATMVNGSPDYDFPELTPSADDDIVFQFYNAATQYDLAITDFNFEKVYNQNTEVSLTGNIENMGAATVNSFDLLYETNNSGIIEKESVSGQNISAFGGTYSFNHAKPLKVNGGYHTLKLWITNINGTQADAVSCNSVITKEFIGSTGQQAPKRPLLEEFTGTWCGWCPRGTQRMDEILQKHPDAVLVSIHGPSRRADTMAIKEGMAIDSTFGLGYPSGNLDRIYQNGQNLGDNDLKWMENYEKLMTAYSPAGIHISQQYNAQERKLDVKAEALFVNYAAPGDFRMNIFLVEDSVVNSHPSFNQVNYLDTDPTSAYYKKGSIIKNYVHRHVLRAVPSTVWGTGNVIPLSPELNKKYAFEYNDISIDSNWNPANIKVIAFLSYYHDDFKKRPILNANHLPLFQTQTSIKGNQLAKEGSRQVSVFPNPANDMANIRLQLHENENISVNLCNSIGQKIRHVGTRNLHSGEHSFSTAIQDLPSGIYFINITSEKTTSVHKLIISR